MSPTVSDKNIPSYKALLLRRKLYWQNRKKVQGENLFDEMRMLASINNKVGGYEWVREQGIPTVDFHVHSDPETALKKTKLSRFVLKPLGGHSSQGVYLLTRDGKGGYDCTMTNRHYANDDEIVSHFARAQKSNKMTSSVIVEEFVEDSFGNDVPLDYKVYAFATGTPMVMQRYAATHIAHDDWAFEFYEADGRALGPVRLKTPGNPGRLRPPSCLSEIFEMAKALVTAARVSFVRVDMYATPDGPVFGEFTPVPNNAGEAFEPAVDAMMGRAWADSLDKLGLDYASPLGKPRPA